MHLPIARFAVVASLTLAVAVFSANASADEPWRRPTSDFGSMPNGWAGYSLLQNQWAQHGRPPLAGGDHGHHDHGHGDHGHGHHGHGHHGHGHHGHGHHGHGHHGHGHHRWRHGHLGYRFGGACPVCFSPFCFNPYCGFYATSGISFSFGVPAVVAPAPWVSRWQAGQVAQVAAARAPAVAAVDRAQRPDVPEPARIDPPKPAAEEGAAAAAEIQRRVAGLRASNSAGRQRADRLMSVADRSFADGDYRRAASKYRQALTAAADYPEVHFRLGHAYVAMGEFDPALEHFLMALELAGTIERPEFSLDQLYGGDPVAEQTHLNRLFDAALREPEDGELLMLVGLALHYGEEPLRARGFFERAAAIAGAHQEPARWFLPPAPAVGD